MAEAEAVAQALQPTDVILIVLIAVVVFYLLPRQACYCAFPRMCNAVSTQVPHQRNSPSVGQAGPVFHRQVLHYYRGATSVASSAAHKAR